MNWKKLRKSIPHRIQVTRKIWYEIVWADDFKDGETLGETRFDIKQIIIKNGLSPKLSVITYLHECVHAFEMENEVGLTEPQVLKMEKTFYFMLKKGNIFGEK